MLSHCKGLYKFTESTYQKLCHHNSVSHILWWQLEVMGNNAQHDVNDRMETLNEFRNYRAANLDWSQTPTLEQKIHPLFFDTSLTKLLPY